MTNFISEAPLKHAESAISEDVKRTGNRRAVPDDAMKFCPSCRELRGNRRTGWTAILKAEQTVGYTCPNCPTWDEPIRRIESRGTVRFRVVVDATPRGATKRKQATKTLESLDDARRFVEEVRAEVAETGGLAAREVTVAALIDKYIKTRVGLRPPTRINYGHQARPVVDALGNVPVRELRASDVEKLIADMVSGELPKRDGSKFGQWAIRAAINRLSQALDMAVRDGLVPRNVARVVERPRQVRELGTELEHWPTEGHEESAICVHLDQFRATSDLDHFAAAWRLTLCGMTRADVMGLRWKDIDLEAGTVTVRQGRVILDGKDDITDDTKSRQRRRTVPVEVIEPGTLRLLKKLRVDQMAHRLRAGDAWQDSGYLVVDELGRPIRPELYSDWFRALCRKAGVPVIRLHSVRHTLAFLLHRLGVTPGDAAALLGHTVEVHLRTYLPDAGASGIAAAAEALGSRSHAA